MLYELCSGDTESTRKSSFIILMEHVQPCFYTLCLEIPPPFSFSFLKVNYGNWDWNYGTMGLISLFLFV